MTPTSTPLVLGAMMFGTRIDESTSFALLDRFVEAGGEWIDTADCFYVLGQRYRARRAE